jgi:hypothetical protein
MTTVDAAEVGRAPGQGTALGGEERAWLYARAAKCGIDPARVHAGPLAAGPDGRIVLSTRAEESALPPLAPAGGGAPVFAAEVVALAAGCTLAVRSTADEPVRLVAGRLELGAGACVELPCGSELHAARAELAEGTAFTLVGKDGACGVAGLEGRAGYFELFGQHPDGFPGNPGGPGGDGGPGGGALYLGSVQGTVTVRAGGGNGGPGGPGGRGGHGWGGKADVRGGDGGPGGPGGPGGNGGPGGTAVVDVEVQSGGAVNLIPLVSRGAPGGGGGDGGKGGSEGKRHGNDGKAGREGDDGGPGELPVFSVRHRG